MKRLRTKEEIESITNRIRTNLGYEKIPTPDIVTLLETEAPKLYPKLNIKRVKDEELPDAEAKADSESQTITVRESVYYEAKNGVPRARMTLAHELGHIALGHVGTRYRKIGTDVNANSVATKKIEETEAKQFAAAFLAPMNLISENDNAEDIRQKFQISNQASEIRKSEFDSNYRKKSGIKRPLPSTVIDFLEKAKQRGLNIKSLD